MSDRHAYTLLRIRIRALMAQRERARVEARTEDYYRLTVAVRRAQEDLQRLLTT